MGYWCEVMFSYMWRFQLAGEYLPPHHLVLSSRLQRSRSSPTNLCPPSLWHQQPWLWVDDHQLSKTQVVREKKKKKLPQTQHKLNFQQFIVLWLSKCKMWNLLTSGLHASLGDSRRRRKTWCRRRDRWLSEAESHRGQIRREKGRVGKQRKGNSNK